MDSLIWTSTVVKSLNISNEVGYSNYVYLPEGIEEVSQIPEGIRIVLPSTINKVAGSPANNIIVYSQITNPEIVSCQCETYDSQYGNEYWNAVMNSTFYIPKGSLEKYLNSDFAKMKALK